jgi:hypothetical protein
MKILYDLVFGDYWDISMSTKLWSKCNFSSPKHTMLFTHVCGHPMNCKLMKMMEDVGGVNNKPR